MCEKKYSIRIFRRAIFGILLSAIGAAADAQQATTLPAVEVVGSRLSRAESEGPLPVTTIDRDDIDRSGQISIAGVLRSQTMNSFGSFTPTSGTGVAQGGA